MQQSSQVLYYGSDAPDVEERWDAADRPFELVGRATGDEILAVLDDADVDCLVCAGDADVLAVVDRVAASHPHVPVVVFAAGDLDAVTALAHDVDHVVDVDDADTLETIAALDSVVERARRDRRERTMLDSLLENIPLSVYFKDRQSRHVAVSDRMPSMIGASYIESPDGVRYHTPADIAGVTDFDLYGPDLAESAVEDDRRVVETEEPIENRIEHAHGSLFDGTFVATSKAPWYDDRGNVVGVVGVTRDVSERKQYEHRLERQNDRLERFASVLSHDLRNPLGVARGRLDFAREDGDEAHFDAIERSLDRMDELVDDVLALARRGETVADPEPVDVGTAAREAWDVVDSGGAALEVDTDLVVTADPGRLRQLFENLFRNAVEHATDDPTDLTVTVDHLPQRRGFAVTDDGEGIPERDRETVFESGFSTAADGTGLGLDIVRTIADAHGWRASVTESDAGGARFQFETSDAPPA